MSGHHKFSKITRGFSEERKAVIEQKTEEIKQNIDSSQLKQRMS